MKKNLSKKILGALLLMLLIGADMSSCKKFVDIPAPRNQIVTETAFADDQTAIATLNGMYSKMMASAAYLTSSSMTLYAGMSADELSYYTASGRDEFIQDQITNANNLVLESYFWNPAYVLIYEANSCIEGASKSPALSVGTKNMVTGEALFVRSLMNFYLVNMFRSIPLATTTDYNITKDLPQSPPEAVYQQITADLKQSISLLKDVYPSAGRARPDRSVAQALLARVYLYQKDYGNAKAFADSIISKSQYQLEADLNKVFLATSNEAIWQLAPVAANYNTWDASYFVPASASAAPTYVLPKIFYDDFENGDKRRESWIGTRVYKGSTVYYPYKYKVRQGATSVTEYNMVFRLAEIYLIRSEANAAAGDLGAARVDLNLIRSRSGLNPVDPALDQQGLLAAIQHERKVELFLEWGHRWLDLKRTGTINTVLGALKPTWKPYAAYYPIPYSQILINTKLIQNEGY